MNVPGALVIFILVWWCVFFGLLPVGVKGRWESDADGVEGADPGAPSDPNLRKKAIWATMISAPIAAAVIAIVWSGVFNFRD
jgi:predicted secreted protein